MSVIDYQNAFSEDQAFTTGTTNYSTNVLDLSGDKDLTAWERFARSSTGSRDQFPGDTPNLWLNVLITTAATSSGSPSVGFILEESADDITYTTVPGFNATGFAKETLVQGYMPMRKPVAGVTKRYLRMRYTVETAALTTCKVSAWLGEPHDQLGQKS